MTKYSLLITGASGYVGKRFSRYLDELCIHHLALTRSSLPSSAYRRNVSVGPSFRDSTGFDYTDVNCVVHLAGPAHILGKEPSLDFFDEANFKILDALFASLKNSSLKTFVYVSSAGVYGDSSLPFESFSVLTSPRPQSNYAISKLNVEQKLLSTCSSLGVNLHIVRPPLIIGRDAVGNFARFLGLVASPFPLPFDSLVSTRSYITLANFCGLLHSLCDHSLRPSTLTVPSDITCTLSDLVRLVSPKKATIRMKPSLLYSAAFLSGRLAQLQKLDSAFVVENSSTCFDELLFAHDPVVEFA